MKYRKPNNQKLFLNFGKPFIKGFYNNQNQLKYNLNTNYLKTKYYPKKISKIYTHILIHIIMILQTKKMN